MRCIRTELLWWKVLLCVCLLGPACTVLVLTTCITENNYFLMHNMMVAKSIAVIAEVVLLEVLTSWVMVASEWVVVRWEGHWVLATVSTTTQVIGCECVACDVCIPSKFQGAVLWLNAIGPGADLLFGQAVGMPLSRVMGWARRPCCMAPMQTTSRSMLPSPRHPGWVSRHGRPMVC